MSVGEKIKTIRKKKGITAKNLAQEIGVSDTYMSAYENGNRNPKEDTLDKIADALGVHPDALMDDEFDSISAMHKLFAIFRKYDGDITTSKRIRDAIESGAFPLDGDDTVYVSFKALSAFMASWFRAYEDMNTRLAELENEKNLSERIRKEQDIKDEFDWFMNLYPSSEPDKEMLEIELKKDKDISNIDRYFRKNIKE